MGAFFPIYPGGGGGGQPQPNNAFVNAQLVGDTLEFTKGDGTQVRVPLSNFAKLDEVNDFTKDNWFEDVILSKTDSLSTNGMGVSANPTRNRYIGVRQHSSNEFDGYISHIKILCDENTALRHVTNVKVYSVRKGANVNNDSVTELLVDNGSFEIKTDGGKHIIIPINKKFVDDTYFVVYDNSTQPVLKARNGVDVALHPDIVNTATQPQIGQAPTNTASKYIYDMTLYGGLSVKETLLSAYVDSRYDQVTGELTLIKADGAETKHPLAIGGGTVTDVVYDRNSYELTVSKNGQVDTTYDLSALLGVRTFNYDIPTRTITVTDENGRQHTIEHIITEWKDLEHVSGYNYANYLDYSSRENGKYYEITGIVGQPPTIGSNAVWSLVNVPVNEDSDYAILRKANQSGRIVYLDSDGNFVRGEEVQYQYVNSWWRANISIPQGSGIAYIGLSFQHGSTGADQIMVVEGHTTEALEPIPYLHGYKISIDGDEVGIRFDPTNTNLIGSVVEDLKELDSRVTTINTSTVKTINDQVPNAQGNISLELENAQDVINFNVEGHTVNSITYATQAEVDNLKTLIII